MKFISPVTGSGTDQSVMGFRTGLITWYMLVFTFYLSSGVYFVVVLLYKLFVVCHLFTKNILFNIML